MKIDTSKLSNKGDLLALLGMIVMAALFAVVFLLAAYGENFAAGFAAATITFKWKVWVLDPLDKVLDKLWSEEDETRRHKGQ